ncbi:MAG: S41 family peptidase [Planctomycetota bacterium]|jgi:carboxyl-terminal processing protease
MARRASLLLLVVASGFMWISRAAADRSDSTREEFYELHKLLVDTLDQVERNYVEEISRRELIEAAIQGVLSKLDPYSDYINPKELDRFRASVDSKFGGVGIRISTQRGYLEVVSPLAGTPAYREGVLAGDRIVEINGASTRGIKDDEAVRRIKGKPGSKVTLTVIHQGNTKSQKITIRREIVRVETVLGDQRGKDDRWEYMLDRDKQIGYVRITGFSRDTARELRDALKKLEEKSLRGLIVDLRFNPGGLLSSAIEVSDMFVAKGRIVSTKGKDSDSSDSSDNSDNSDNSERSWDAHQDGTFGDFPMVVLVNRYSASASEIVSACLQDHKRAVIMGERTWGKGSVQNVIPLEDGRSALKLTTANYCRPSGETIHRSPDAKEGDPWGVKPDESYNLRLPGREMLRLMQYRHDRDILRPGDTEATESEPKEAEKTDPENASAKSGEPGDDERPPKPSAEESESEPEEFADRQLQMAIDYLNDELARAD